jgi:hypothetical protein
MWKDLVERFPTWEQLHYYLKSPEGGSLDILGSSPFVIIRYEKGKSNFTIPHVKAFRSVVWNTETNRPVSVTPCKSEMGESIPTGSITDYEITTFQDGILIGTFWDGAEWKIHTRSVLGANCCWYGSPIKNLFQEAMPATLWDRLDKTACYSWILQHPENRIVCQVPAPRVILVEVNQIKEDGSVSTVPRAELHLLGEYLPQIHSFPTWDAMKTRLLEWNERYTYNFQGFVIRHPEGSRWKIRTESYNKARWMRNNTPRRDFVWLSLWKEQTLNTYLRIFPEEKFQALAIVSRWKQITRELFDLYTKKFRSHSTVEIPPKFKGILYFMHGYYLTVLKPARKTFTIHEAIDWMNTRDIPIMLGLIHYELRAAIATVE